METDTLSLPAAADVKAVNSALLPRKVVNMSYKFVRSQKNVKSTTINSNKWHFSSSVSEELCLCLVPNYIHDTDVNRCSMTWSWTKTKSETAEDNWPAAGNLLLQQETWHQFVRWLDPTENLRGNQRRESIAFKTIWYNMIEIWYDSDTKHFLIWFSLM